jgi:hypothetical protein
MYFTEISLFFVVIPLYRDALVSFWHDFKYFVAVGMELQCRQPFTNSKFHFLIIEHTS